MGKTMRLFCPLKWDKTNTDVGKTNAYLNPQKLWSMTNNSVNNPSVSPRSKFFTWNRIPVNQNIFKISNKNFGKSMMCKVFWKSIWEVVLIFVFTVFQMFLWRYFNYFNDDFQNSYLVEQWAGLQPATLQKRTPSYACFVGFSNFLETPISRNTTSRPFLSEV